MSRVWGKVRGDWQPGLPQNVVQWISVVLSLMQLSAGLDYVTGDKPGIATFRELNSAMPIRFWGALCITASLCIFVGFMTHRYMPVAVGSFMSCFTYAAIAIVVTEEMLRNAPVDGFRIPLQFLGLAIIWFLGGLGTLAMMQWRDLGGNAYGPQDH